MDLNYELIDFRFKFEFLDSILTARFALSMLSILVSQSYCWIKLELEAVFQSEAAIESIEVLI